MRRAVVDQDGLKILVVGILVSLFFGLIIKSQVRESVVRSRLELLIEKTKKDVSISFDSVQVHLSDWGLPRPMIEVKGLRISPLSRARADLDQPQLYIDSVIIPLTLNLLFSEVKRVEEVRAGLIELRLGQNAKTKIKQIPSNSGSLYDSNLDKLQNGSEENEDVQHQKQVENAALSEVITKSVQVNSFKKTESESASVLNNFEKWIFDQRLDLKEIKIDRLRIISRQGLKSSLDFNAVLLSLVTESRKLKQATLQAQFLAFKDPVKNYYLFKSDLKMNLDFKNNKFTSDSITLDIKGYVIDRLVDLKVRLKNDLSGLTFISTMDRLSLKTINYIFKIENSDFPVYDFLTGAQISAGLTGEFDFYKKSLELKFSQISAQLLNGFLEMNELVLKTNELGALEIKPVNLHFNNIDLSKLLEVTELKDIKRSLNQAGIASGYIYIENKNNFKLRALVENTQIIFINKANRVDQNIKSYNLLFQKNDNKIHLTLNDFLIENAKVIGSIKYESDLKSQKSIEADLRGQLLSEKSVQLFTGYSYNPELKFKFSNKNNQILSFLEIDEAQIYSYKIEDIKIKYEKKLDSPIEMIEVQAQNLRPFDPLSTPFDQFIKKFNFKNANLNFKDVDLKIVRNQVQDEFEVDLEFNKYWNPKSKQIYFKLKSTLNDQEQLNGTVIVKENVKGKSITVNKEISGTLQNIQVQ